MRLFRGLVLATLLIGGVVEAQNMRPGVRLLLTAKRPQAAAPPVGGTFLADDFSGTANTQITAGGANETPASGTWTAITGGGGGDLRFATSATRIRSSGTVPMAYIADDATPADANYSVTGVLTAVSLVNNAAATYIGGRFTAASYDGYVCGFVGNSGGSGAGVWRLRKYTAGVVSSLASDSATTLTLSQNYTVVLTMNGTSIGCTVDGVAIAGSPVTDSTHSATGFPIVAHDVTVAGATTGTHIDNIQAND